MKELKRNWLMVGTKEADDNRFTCVFARKCKSHVHVGKVWIRYISLVTLIVFLSKP